MAKIRLLIFYNTSHRLQNRSLAGVVKTEGSLKTFISALDVCVCIFLYLSRLLSEHLFHAYTEKVIDRTKVFAEFNYTPESKNYQLEKSYLANNIKKAQFDHIKRLVFSPLIVVLKSYKVTKWYHAYNILTFSVCPYVRM